MPHVPMAFTIDSGNIFGSCFFYLFSGIIAGTVAQFIARGRMGCLLGNFFLGIVGAILGSFILDFLQQHIATLKTLLPDKTGFLGTTIIASIMATLLAVLFSQARKAERRHQANLLEQRRQEQA